MARLKIAQFATADMSIGLLLLDHIKALQEMGHEVVALCSPGDWVAKVRAEGVPVETVPIAREISPFQDLKTLFALYCLFRKHKFDVVHTHTPKAGLLGPIAARMARVPIVVHTIHGLLFHDRMSRRRRWLFWIPEKITASFSDFLLSQSEEDVRVAVESKLCSAQKLRYLGNGIDVRRFSPHQNDLGRKQLRAGLGLREGDFVVGTVGRLVYEKGMAEFFAAAQVVSTKRPQVRFIVVGAEETEQSDAVSRQTVDALTQAGIVHFLGFQQAMPEYYSIMDGFVLPSHREGIPRACMEAAAMELPIIATDIRGCREVVSDGVTGVLVPVRDAEALARAIESFASHRQVSVAMGKQGRLRMLKQFDVEQVLGRLRDFYSSIEKNLGSAIST